MKNILKYKLHVPVCNVSIFDLLLLSPLKSLIIGRWQLFTNNWSWCFFSFTAGVRVFPEVSRVTWFPTEHREEIYRSEICVTGEKRLTSDNMLGTVILKFWCTPVLMYPSTAITRLVSPVLYASISFFGIFLMPQHLLNLGNFFHFSVFESNLFNFWHQHFSIKLLLFNLVTVYFEISYLSHLWCPSDISLNKEEKSRMREYL